MRVSNIGPSMADTFGRSVSSGWGGTSPVWTIVSGTAAQFSVNGSRALITISDAVNVSQIITAAVNVSADVDLMADMRCEALATGGPLNGSIIGRYVSGTDHYHAQLIFNTSGVIGLAIRRGATTLATLANTGLTHATGTVYRLRFRAAGSLLAAKVWLAAGTEPGWMLTTTETVVTAAGIVGARSFRGTGNTNVNPPLSWDNFTVNNPQVLTVTRSLNGVIKPHNAGAGVQVTHKARPGLGAR